MRLALIGCLLLLGYTTAPPHLHVPRGNSTPEPSVWDRLDNLIKNKCLKNANKQQYKEVMQELNALSMTHWHSLMAEEHRNKLHTDLHCIVQKPLIANYVQRAMDKFETCLHPDERFLKEFIMKGYKTYSQHFCTKIGALELPGNTMHCVRKFDGNSHSSPQVHCFKRSRVFSNQSVGQLMTKQQLCEDLLDIRHCYEHTLAHQCPHATLLKQFQVEIFNEGLSHCHDIWYSRLRRYLKLGI